MSQKVNFSQADLQTLADALYSFESTCCPSDKDIEVSVQIEPPTKGISSSPDRYDTVDDLNDRLKIGQLFDDISVIKTGDTNWFYNAYDPYDFYSSKAHVSLMANPQRLLDPTLHKNKMIERTIRNMLAQVAQNPKTTPQQAQAHFTKNICKKIFEIDPPREHILNTLIIGAERIRRVLFQHLIKYHAQEIQNHPDFAKFKSTKSPTMDPETLKIQFLKQGQRGYVLAQKMGYLTKNAAKLIHYQELRDEPRHPSTKMKDPLANPTRPLTQEEFSLWAYHRGYTYINPTQLYRDFSQALSFVKPQQLTDQIEHDEATCTIWAYWEIDRFKTLLSKDQKYPNSLEWWLKKFLPEQLETETITITAPKKKPQQKNVSVFRDFYIYGNNVTIADWADPSSTPQQLIFDERKFRNWAGISNTSAHANPGYVQSVKILSEDLPILTDFVDELEQAYAAKKRRCMCGEMEWPTKVKIAPAPVQPANTK